MLCGRDFSLEKGAFPQEYFVYFKGKQRISSGKGYRRTETKSNQSLLFNMALVAQQLGGLQITLLGALGDPCHTGLLHLLLAHADVAVAILNIMLGLGVRSDDALEVAQDDLAGGSRRSGSWA